MFLCGHDGGSWDLRLWEILRSSLEPEALGGLSRRPRIWAAERTAGRLSITSEHFYIVLTNILVALVAPKTHSPLSVSLSTSSLAPLNIQLLHHWLWDNILALKHTRGERLTETRRLDGSSDCSIRIITIDGGDYVNIDSSHNNY